MKHYIKLLIVALMMPMLASGNYNSLVEKDHTVSQSWAEVENQYQRRADLIPNLVNTVKGYAAHESSTLEAVTNARAGLSKAYNEANDVTHRPENLAVGYKHMRLPPTSSV